MTINSEKFLPANKKFHIAGVILAGGKSSRMGQNKAFLTLPGGQTFLDYSTCLLAPFVSKVFVSCSSKKEYAGYNAVEDKFPNLGPASGIFSSLLAAKAMGATDLFVLSCDLPAMRTAILKRIYTAHFKFPRHHLVTTLRNPVNGFLELTCAIYSLAALKFFDSSLRAGKTALRFIFPENAIHALSVPPQEKSCFKNCNTPEDYQNIIGLENKDN